MDKTATRKFKALAGLAATIFFLIMSTYAWFTSNRLVKVNSLEIIVQASEGFQISLDAVNWKSIIQSNEITGTLVNDTYSANKNHVPDEMVPFSTATLTDASSGYMDMFFGIVNADEISTSPTYGEYVITSKKAVEAQGSTEGFIAFDLFFKTNRDIYLHLDTEAMVTDNAIVGSSRENKGMENAARIAFVVQGFIPITDTRTGTALSGAAQALKYTDYQDGRNVTIWEPNYLSHTDETKLEAFNMFGIPTTSTIWDDQIIYDGVYNEISDTSPILLIENTETDNSGYFKSIPSSRVVTTPKGTRTNTTDTGIELEAGITKVRIYMWLEGQDLDCGDSASGSDVRFDLLFKAEYP